MGKLSVSILSADLAHLADQVKLVEPYADAIHVDVMDGHFAPPITFGGVLVRSLRPCTPLVLHGHLMVDAPESQFDELAQAGMDIVSFHIEAVEDPAPVIRKARDAGMRVGMTVSPPTPVEALFPYLEELDDVMVMSVYPGWAGQRFMPEALPEAGGGPRRARPPGPQSRRPDRRRREARERAALHRGRRHRAHRGLGDLPGRGPRGRGPGAEGDRGGEGLMPETILVVDDDPDIARFVEVNLRSAGYEVAVAADGEQALEMAMQLRPDLVLLDVMMPRIDGFEVAQRLRRNPQTANTSIIMLTAKALSTDKVLGLTAGADDYIIKPFDPIELLARVKGTLRRAKEMRNLSPLTGLPGNIRIQEEIERMVRERRPFAVLYCDLDNFKAYNDQKGFVRGDRLIQATARIIQDSVVELAGSEGFVGHVGGDDFVAIVPPDVAEPIAKRIVERFDAQVHRFYDPEDVERGYVEVEDRKGVLQRLPLAAISVGIATTAVRTFAHYGEAVAVATEMKQFAKRQAGSSYAIDRRAGT
ncbi:MAG: hypothetical protein KatS3mg014_1299 [Actinomycetota bacterium]|nr:MAG: hypothetical protein KatS3mg014_1299 [Actinomycetota bacterium]